MIRKYIHITDIHAALSAGYRVDDIMDSLADKLKQVKSIAEEIHAEAIFMSGDLFNSNLGAKIPYRLASDVAAQLKDLELPILGIAGNHDMHMGTLLNHPLNTFYNTGLIIDVSKEPGYLAGEKIRVVGWNHKYNKDLDQFSRFAKCETSVITVGLIHLVMGEKPGMYYEEPQYGIEEFASAPVEVFLNGHIHTSFGPIRNSAGQLFCQPGALLRTNSSSEEITRKPSINIVTIDDKTGFIAAEYRPLKVKEGIFKDWKREQIKVQSEQINTFIESVQNLNKEQDKSIPELIQEADLEPEVKSILLEHLG